MTGLRQTVLENGVAHALTRASEWLKELDLSWADGGNKGTPRGFDAALDPTGQPPSAARPSLAFGPYQQIRNMSWGPARLGANASSDGIWALGHVQPMLSNELAGSATAPGTTADPDGYRGTAEAERALASHDVEVGLQVPFLPWSAEVAADRYWWGARDFVPQVSGTRVSLKLAPAPNVELEGGRTEDERGMAGFVGLRYRIPLDTPR